MRSSINDLPPESVIIAPLRLLITGGTGFIGTPLVTLLCERGCDVTVLTRDRHRAARSQPAEGVTWLESLNALPSDSQFDVIINLAGESLASGRWTRQKKERLIDSRLSTTAALYDLVERLAKKPDYLINGSAVGFYGPQREQKLDEAGPSAESFSHSLCAAWENEADTLSEFGTAVCKLRLGVVLSAEGGAFAQIKQSFRFKVATQMSTGEHYFSWVHRQDLLRIFEFLLAREPHERLVGPVNATAPGALTYRELCTALAKHYDTLIKLPLPAPLLHLLVGEMADELLLTGQRVEPQKLRQHGFSFNFPSLPEALPTLT